MIKLWTVFALFMIWALAAEAAIDRVTTTASKAEKTSTSKAADTPTKVMKKVTNAAGAVVSQEVVYSQKFRTTYNSPISNPPAGTIGLGTIKGSIGKVKTENIVTMTE